jgi:outer membrane receptor for ferrienterochelin and colicin
LEATLSYQRAEVGASATLFRNDMSDLIAAVTVPHETAMGRPVRTYANLAEARLTGASGSIRWQVAPHLETRGSATYVRGFDRRTLAPLPQVPPVEGSVSLRVTPGSYLDWIDVEGRAATAQNRAAPHSGEVSTPGYGIVNLRSGFTAYGTGFTTGVENVLNAHYRGHLDPVGLYRPGRNIYLKVSRSF